MYLLDELLSIIENRDINILFQPIINHKEKTILGYEGLARGPSNSPLHSPINLFDVAQRHGHLFALDVLCRQSAFQRFSELKLPGKLFVNVIPNSLLQPDFRPGKTHKLLSEYGLSAKQVVIELTEHYPMANYNIMMEATTHYRSMGFEIALDDLGAGYSGLQSWLKLRPDYVKLDQQFINQINNDSVKLEFVRSLTDIAIQLNSKVIAEGVESIGEFEIIKTLNIDLMQGYYLARPNALPSKQVNINVLTPVDSNKILNHPIHPSMIIADLSIQTPKISPNILTKSVCKIFSQSPQLAHIVVTDEQQRPLGIVQRQYFINLMLPQYAYDLHGYKPIRDFMQEAVIVDHNESLEQVSQRLTDIDDWSNTTDFIITKNNLYFGVGRILDLLQKMTNLQIMNARYANPLTLLSGNIPINQHIQYLLQKQKAFTICYYDLDNFKPFNDAYSYSKGDLVIQKVAHLLQQHSDSAQDFIGHVGGDDFVVVFRSFDWQQRCQDILETFQRQIPQFYDDCHCQMGGIDSIDRQGNACFFPIISLSIGAVVVKTNQDDLSYHDIANMASKAKTEAKKQMGNSLFIERRLQPAKASLASACAIPLDANIIADK